MANFYVYSGATGTGSGNSWANAKTTLAAATSAASAGDDIWVADDHSESSASAQTISIGTTASPSRVMCARRAGGTVPPVAADLRTTAVVATTGANTIQARGVCYYYGIVFNAGSGASSASVALGITANARTVFEACSFNLTNTSASSVIQIGSDVMSRIVMRNCTVSFGSTSQKFDIYADWIWENFSGSAAITGATLPTTLASSSSSNIYRVRWRGLDLSPLGVGATLVNLQLSGFEISNSKLGSGVTVAAAPTTRAAPDSRLIGSHSSSSVRRDEIYSYHGTLTTETTIKRTAGASDGTTAYCWKVVTTASTLRTMPFETFEGALWNGSTGSSKTLTVHIVTDNVTLTDAEIWIEADYLGAAGAPVATTVTDANATVLTTAANQTSDSAEAWTTTGLGTPVKQKLDVSFTPQMAGPVRWRVCVAKASTTVYVCPKAELS